MSARSHALLLMTLAACREPAHQAPTAAAASPVAESPSDAAVSDAARSDAARSDAARSDAARSDATLPALPTVTTDWCVAGMLGLDEETCYVLPARDPARALVIYLPGIVPPVAASPQKENVDRIVHDVAVARGFTALIPRGRRGIGPAYAKDYYAWPTNAGDYATHAPAMIAHWLEAKAMLERSLGRPFEHLYVAGSSSGAWFVVALAFRGALAADGWAAISGGSPGAWTSHDLAARTPKPFYVGYGANDPSAADGARALASLLRAAKWPVEEKAHPFGHGARAVYLEEALALWAR